MLIDTHCHLNFKAFKNQRNKIITSAVQQGIEKIIVPGSNLKTSKQAVFLAEKYPEIYASVGIHPHHTALIESTGLNKIVDQLTELIKKYNPVAVGECGLDYYRYQKTKYNDYQITPKFKQNQKKLFSAQIELAKKHHLPLIVHNRDASVDLLESLKEIGHFGVIHCFQGRKSLLKWAFNNDFYIGITGIVTFSKQMQEVVSMTPIEKLLIETDAPYLTPEPIRQEKRFPNKPENVKIVAQTIADIKRLSLSKVEDITTKNTIQLFKVND